jgi:hypothetical protein
MAPSLLLNAPVRHCPGVFLRYVCSKGATTHITRTALVRALDQTRGALDRAAECGPCSRQSRHHRADRDAEHIGDLSIREALQIPQPNQLARPLGQALHGASDHHRVIDLKQQRLGIGGGLDIAVMLLVEQIG